MIRPDFNYRSSDLPVVLPYWFSPTEDSYKQLKEQINNLPSNNLAGHQHRFINIMPPLLFSAGLFMRPATIHEITELMSYFYNTDQIRPHGVSPLLDNLFRSGGGDCVASGLYQVQRCDDGKYIFGFNDSIIPYLIGLPHE